MLPSMKANLQIHNKFQFLISYSSLMSPARLVEFVFKRKQNVLAFHRVLLIQLVRSISLVDITLYEGTHVFLHCFYSKITVHVCFDGVLT